MGSRVNNSGLVLCGRRWERKIIMQGRRKQENGREKCLAMAALTCRTKWCRPLAYLSRLDERGTDERRIAQLFQIVISNDYSENSGNHVLTPEFFSEA